MNIHQMELPVEDIMLNYRPVYPGDSPTWGDTMSYLMNHPADHRIVTTLMKRLEEDGTFREPILLETKESREISDAISWDGEKDTSPLYVLNGTHRVVAAYLIQQLSIPVAYDQTSTLADLEAFQFDDQVVILETNVVFEQDAVVDPAITLLSETSSFELSRSIWMTSSVISGVGKKSCIMWDLSEEEINTLSDDELVLITQHVCEALDAAEIRYDHVSTSVELLIPEAE